MESTKDVVYVTRGNLMPKGTWIFKCLESNNEL